METGRPVTVMAHIDGGGSRKAVFNPDGTNEHIWDIDKVPTPHGLTRRAQPAYCRLMFTAFDAFSCTGNNILPEG